MVLCPFVLCKEGVGTACDHVESKRRIAAGILSLGTCFASGCLIKLAMSGVESPYELIGLAYDAMNRHHVHVTYDTSMAMLFLVSAARNYHRSASRGQDFNEL